MREFIARDGLLIVDTVLRKEDTEEAPLAVEDIKLSRLYELSNKLTNFFVLFSLFISTFRILLFYAELAKSNLKLSL